MTTAAQTPGRTGAAGPMALRVAGLLVHVWPLFGELAALCRDYVVPYRTADVPDLVVRTTPADLERERALATAGSWSDAYLETLHVLRRLAEAAPTHNRLLVHGAAVAYGGRAYLFCAPSGTGKSTHLRLWRELLGNDAQVINGDKPLIELRGAGDAVVHGTPWAGKEGWQVNASAPLGGICFVERAGATGLGMERLTPAEALDRIMSAVYLPGDSGGALQALGLVDGLLGAVPLWLMHADISVAAARMSFEALVGGCAPGVGNTSFEEQQ